MNRVKRLIPGFLGLLCATVLPNVAFADKAYHCGAGLITHMAVGVSGEISLPPGVEPTKSIVVFLDNSIQTAGDPSWLLRWNKDSLGILFYDDNTERYQSMRAVFQASMLSGMPVQVFTNSSSSARCQSGASNYVVKWCTTSTGQCKQD